MGYLANYCSVSPHFCCNNVLYLNVRGGYDGANVLKCDFFDADHV